MKIEGHLNIIEQETKSLRARLKNMVEVVRCKDCVHHKNAPKTTDVWCERLDGLLPKDWFCADGDDGERREDE